MINENNAQKIFKVNEDKSVTYTNILSTFVKRAQAEFTLDSIFESLNID